MGLRAWLPSTVVGEELSPGQLRELERSRLRALVDGDIAAAERLHGDDYQLVPPGGTPLSKDEYLGAIASGDLRYLVFEPVSEPAVLVGGQVAALRYPARIEVRFGAQTDAGEFWHTDLWMLRPYGWQAIWSQATRIRSPG